MTRIESRSQATQQNVAFDTKPQAQSRNAQGTARGGAVAAQNPLLGTGPADAMQVGQRPQTLMAGTVLQGAATPMMGGTAMPAGQNPFAQLLFPGMPMPMAMPMRATLPGMPVSLSTDLTLNPEALCSLGEVQGMASTLLGEGCVQTLAATQKVQEGAMLTIADGLEGYNEASGAPQDFASELGAVIVNERDPRNAPNAAQSAMLARQKSFPLGMDVNAFVQAVLRESYMLQCDMMKDYADKVKFYNQLKKQIRAKKERAYQLRSLNLPEGAPIPAAFLIDWKYFNAEIGRWVEYGPSEETVAAIEAEKARREAKGDADPSDPSGNPGGKEPEAPDNYEGPLANPDYKTPNPDEEEPPAGFTPNESAISNYAFAQATAPTSGELAAAADRVGTSYSEHKGSWEDIWFDVFNPQGKGQFDDIKTNAVSLVSGCVVGLTNDQFYNMLNVCLSNYGNKDLDKDDDGAGWGHYSELNRVLLKMLVSEASLSQLESVLQKDGKFAGLIDDAVGDKVAGNRCFTGRLEELRKKAGGLAIELPDGDTALASNLESLIATYLSAAEASTAADDGLQKTNPKQKKPPTLGDIGRQMTAKEKALDAREALDQLKAAMWGLSEGAACAVLSALKGKVTGGQLAAGVLDEVLLACDGAIFKKADPANWGFLNEVPGSKAAAFFDAWGATPFTRVQTMWTELQAETSDQARSEIKARIGTLLGSVPAPTLRDVLSRAADKLEGTEFNELFALCPSADELNALFANEDPASLTFLAQEGGKAAEWHAKFSEAGLGVKALEGFVEAFINAPDQASRTRAAESIQKALSGMDLEHVRLFFQANLPKLSEEGRDQLFALFDRSRLLLPPAPGDTGGQKGVDPGPWSFLIGCSPALTRFHSEWVLEPDHKPGSFPPGSTTTANEISLPDEYAELQRTYSAYLSADPATQEERLEDFRAKIAAMKEPGQKEAFFDAVAEKLSPEEFENLFFASDPDRFQIADLTGWSFLADQGGRVASWYAAQVSVGTLQEKYAAYAAAPEGEARDKAAAELQASLQSMPIEAVRSFYARTAGDLKGKPDEFKKVFMLCDPLQRLAGQDPQDWSFLAGVGGDTASWYASWVQQNPAPSGGSGGNSGSSGGGVENGGGGGGAPAPSDGASGDNSSKLDPKYAATFHSQVIDDYIETLDQSLQSVGDDAQLANMDLQNALQQQQQIMQMMSNISKMLHDTAMSIIRKIGG